MSAFDDHVHEALNRTYDALRARVESDLAASREELARALSEEGARVVQEATEAAVADAKRDAERQVNEWRETAARDDEERERDIEARERQAEAREHDAEARERDADARRLEAEARRQALERVADDLRRSLDDARQQALLDLEAAQEDVELARRDADLVRSQLDERLQDIHGFEERIRGFHDAVAQAARLADGIKVIDRASSLGEALDGLVQFAGRDAGRAVVFLVKGDRLRDWRAVGFDGGSQSPLEVGIDEPGAFADAMQGNRGTVRRDGLPTFAAGSGHRYAVTLPVMVAGAVVAILYADGPDADNDGEPPWADRLDVLARYAGRMLESITIRQAAGLSAARPLTGSASPPLSELSDHPSAGSVQ